MTDNQPTFADLAAALTEAHGKTTPGEWINGFLCDEDRKPLTPEGMKQEMEKSIDNRAIDLFFTVSAGDREPTIAATGCGPTSQSNGDYIALAHNTLPALIAAAQGEIERLRGELRSAMAYLGEAHDALRDADLMLRGQAIQTPESFHWVTVDVPDHIETKMGEIDEELQGK